MGSYSKKMYERVTIQKDNLVRVLFRQSSFPVYKLNLYHQSSKSRQRTYNRIQETHLYV